MKEYSKRAEEVVKQENSDKLGSMENRRDKYEKRHEIKLQKEE